MINRDISNYVLSCETCARANNSNNAEIPMRFFRYSPDTNKSTKLCRHSIYH